MNKSFEGMATLTETTFDDLDAVVHDIFANCDSDNTGYLLVSKIIEYVEPFMAENTTALFDLKHSLDPDNTNRQVDLQTVNEALKEWSLKLRGISSEDATIQDVNQLQNGSFTPHTSSKRALKINTRLDCESEISCWYENMNSKPAIQLEFEEQMKDLFHKYRKVMTEMEGARNYQSSVEEINEKLHKEIRELKKQIVMNQSVINELRKEKLDYDELSETLNKENIEKMKLEKLLDKTEKEIENITKINENLELEKLTLESKYEKLIQEHKQDLNVINELETVINIKETEFTALENKVVELKSEIERQKEEFTHISEDNEKLKTQKTTYEKYLRKSLNKHTTSSMSPYLSLKSADSLSGTNSNQSINKRIPPFKCDRFSFFNYEDPIMRKMQCNNRRHSISNIPMQAETKRKSEKFNLSLFLCANAISSPLNVQAQNSIIALKGKRKSQDTYGFESQKRYDLDLGRLSLTSNNGTADLQFSFNEDDMHWQMQLLDNSRCDSLQFEMLQASQDFNPANVWQESNVLTEENYSANKILQDKCSFTEATTKELHDVEVQVENPDIFKEKYENGLNRINELQLELSMIHFRIIELNAENNELRDTLSHLQTIEKRAYQLQSGCGSTTNSNTVSETESIENEDEPFIFMQRNSKKRVYDAKRFPFGKLEVRNERLLHKLDETVQRLNEEESKSKICLENIEKLNCRISSLENTNLNLNVCLEKYKNNYTDQMKEIKKLNTNLVTLSCKKDNQKLALEEKILKMGYRQEELLANLALKDAELSTIVENRKLANKSSELVNNHNQLSPVFYNNRMKYVDNDYTNVIKTLLRAMISCFCLMILFHIIINMSYGEKKCSLRYVTLSSLINDVGRFFYRVVRLPGRPPV